MYCGNNRNSKQVKNGNKIGSRYECLKKGIGVGMNLPLDLDYLDEYIPIDSRKIYCGKAPRRIRYIRKLTYVLYKRGWCRKNNEG